MRILLCDDASFMRNILKDIFVKAGHEICGEAENGNVAISLYKELKPDLVTMDITMPEKDGLQALKEIRAFDQNANIIMCSAMGQQIIVLEAIKNGAFNFVVKPFKAEKVLEAISNIKE